MHLFSNGKLSKERPIFRLDCGNVAAVIKPIMQLGAPVLRKRSLPVEDFGSTDLGRLIEDLSDTLQDAQKRFGYGRGIAAPQIGELKRVVFIGASDFESALVNPEIKWLSPATFEVWDSCFSFNVDFFVLVDRHCSIRVEYFDHIGKKHLLEAKGELSELLQHEMDHLDGVLATDKMKNRKAIMMRSEWEKAFKS